MMMSFCLNLSFIAAFLNLYKVFLGILAKIANTANIFKFLSNFDHVANSMSAVPTPEVGLPAQYTTIRGYMVSPRRSFTPNFNGGTLRIQIVCFKLV